MKSFKCLAAVLLPAASCAAQTHIIPVGKCTQQAQRLAQIVRGIDNKPADWYIYYFCSAQEFETFKLRHDVYTPSDAVSMLGKKHLTYVGQIDLNTPSAVELMRHEIQHINCQCSLDEVVHGRKELRQEARSIEH